MTRQHHLAIQDLERLCVLGEDAYDEADLVVACARWQEALSLCESPAQTGLGAFADASTGNLGVIRVKLLLNLGVAWHEQFEHERASQFLEDAYAACDALSPDAIDAAERAALKADVLVNAANAWCALGHGADAESLYVEAIATYRSLIDAGRTDLSMNEAVAHAALGNALTHRCALADAQPHYRAALDVLEPLASAGDELAALRAAGVHSNLVVMCYRKFHFDEATAHLHRAHRALAALVAQGGSVRVKAAFAANLIKFVPLDTQFDGGSVTRFAAAEILEELVASGRRQYSHELAFWHMSTSILPIGYQNKLDHLNTAVELLAPLRRGGNVVVIGDMAAVYVNQSNALGPAGAQLPWIIAVNRARILLEAVRGSNPALYSLRLAIALTSLGAAHGDRGRAMRCIALQRRAVALARSVRSVHSDPQVIDHVTCTALANCGTAQRWMGELDASLETYNEILAICESHDRWRDMVTPFGLFYFGETFNLLGRYAQAQALYDFGLETEEQRSLMTAAGRSASSVRISSLALRNAWQHAASRNGEALPPDEADALHEAACRAHRLLMRLHAVESDELDFSNFRIKAVTVCVCLLRFLVEAPIPTSRGDWRGMRLQLAELSLKLVSTWLRRAQADDIDSFSSVIRLVLVHLQNCVVALGDDALAVRWFVRTQGLRAQRAAIAAPGEARTQAWRLWNALDRLDLERMGSMISSSDAEQAARGLELRAQRRELQRQLDDSGQANPSLYLEDTDLEDRLRNGCALLMLARGCGSDLLALVLSRDRSGDLRRQLRVLPLGAHASRDCRDDVQDVDRAFASSPSMSFASSRWLIAEPAATEEASGHLRLERQAEAIAQLDALAAAVKPLADELRTQGLQANLIPSGDLHALPWHHALSAPSDGHARLRVFATVADWWRLQDQKSARAPALRWVISAYDAADSGNQAHRLYWVLAEEHLSRRLWGEASVCAFDQPAAEAPANALLACGHGIAPEGNLALAGVWIATEAQAGAPQCKRVLSAQSLESRPAIRRLLLSCCVLGRTDDVFGEPLGLMAQAFQYGAEFAMGALIQLDDLEAMLFSLAYQWALKKAVDEQGADADWVEVFLSLQAGIREQRWPVGFAAWLSAELPGTLEAVIPDARKARDDDDAFESRQQWHRLLSGLAIERGVNEPLPRSSQAWDRFIRAVADTLSARPSAKLRAMAAWMVVLGM